MRHGANKIFLLAILISLAAHVGLASIGTQFHYLGGWTSARPERVEEMTILLDDAPEPEKPEPPELSEELLLGDPDGQGYASFAAEGLREQLARQADNDQSFESLDRRGFGAGGESSSPQMEMFAQARPQRAALLSPARQASPPAVPAFGVASPTPMPKPTKGEQAIAGVRRTERIAPVNSTRSEMTVAPSETVKADAPDANDTPSRVEKPEPTAVAVVPSPAVAAPETPSAVSSNVASADPAPQSDREVDPFSTLGSVEFREGNLEVRAGRQVKPRRPKLGLAGKVSLFELESPTVVLDVSIDATGKVTGAEVVKSSGKLDIDQPTRVAMYEWWFEPKRDPSGNPVADRFRFKIVFH